MAELMTLEELAEYLRFTKKTIYSLIKDGDIPAIKLGSKWRFDKERIDEWLLRNMTRTKARVLVVDDEHLVRSLVYTTLSRQGYDVVTANNGLEAINHVENAEFDLVLLDMLLPDMDGAQVYKAIKDISPNILVVIITGYPNSEILEKAMREGPLGVMLKPFTPRDISEMVNKFLLPKPPEKRTTIGSA